MPKVTEQDEAEDLMGMFRRRGGSADEPSAAVEAEVSILRQMLLHYPRGQRPNFGAPTRCPSCGDFGFIHGVDHAKGATFNECFSCGAQWVVTRRGLRALREELDTGGVVIHEPAAGNGVLLGMDERLDRPSLLLDDRDDLLAPAARRDTHRDDILAMPRPDLHDAPPPPRNIELGDGPPVPEPVRRPITIPAGPKLDVLLIEDSDLDAELIRAILAPVVPNEMSLYHATTSREGKSVFAHRTVDLVLLDLGLPDSNGIDTLRSWRHTGLPIAVVTGDDDLTLASAAKRAGAAEFVPKRRLAHLIDDGASGTDELAGIIRRAALSRPT